MSAVASIASYLRDLDAHLHVGTETRLRLLEEVREHLEQDVGRLEAEGLSPEEALEAAIARFGTPHEVAARVRPEVAGLGTDAADGLGGRLERALERAPLRTYLSIAAVILAANVAIGAWAAHHYHLHHLRTRALAWPAAEVGLVAAFGLRDLLSRRGGEADRRRRLRAWDASHPVSRWALILLPLSLVNLVALSGPGLRQLRQL
ncbi:MAG TPA: permease prefix domain 1-containing protein, partial [Acidimicrobiales bacterium]|nr:permease prefix domain 1-containing protein [Acidimicrobiales bacterium]